MLLKLDFKKSHHENWLKSFKSALENTIENNEEILRDLIKTLESHVSAYEESSFLSLFQEKFPDLLTVTEKSGMNLEQAIHHWKTYPNESVSFTKKLEAFYVFLTGK